MLIGELKTTSGNVYIDGHDMIDNFSQAKKHLGYCPQFDYLHEYLTVQETFELFAQLRGIEAQHIENNIEDLMLVFKLNDLRNKIVKNIRLVQLESGY